MTREKDTARRKRAVRSPGLGEQGEHPKSSTAVKPQPAAPKSQPNGSTASFSWMKLPYRLLEDPTFMQMRPTLRDLLVRLSLLAARSDGQKTGALPPVRDIAWHLRAEAEELESDMFLLAELGYLSQRKGRWFHDAYVTWQKAAASTERWRAWRDRQKAKAQTLKHLTSIGQIADTDSDSDSDTESESDKDSHSEGVGELTFEERKERAIAFARKQPHVKDAVAYGLTLARDPEWVPPEPLTACQECGHPVPGHNRGCPVEEEE